jgi:hypothetical protein
MINRKKLAIIFLVLALAMHPLFAFAQNGNGTGEAGRQQYFTDPGAMIVDLVVARPAGLVATLGGTAFFILSLPFSALGGNMDEAWQSLAVAPAEYTFKRPLGKFED